jgi:TfoX/Sxy family transcriptional regulator of competence genes
VDAQARFDALIDEFTGIPGVQLPEEAGRRRFGADTLRLDGTIVAMLVDGAVVLKLPGDRVAELIESGCGAPWDAGPGRRMRQWVTVADDDPATTLTLGREALEFARARRR